MLYVVPRSPSDIDLFSGWPDDSSTESGADAEEAEGTRPGSVLYPG